MKVALVNISVPKILKLKQTEGSIEYIQTTNLVLRKNSFKSTSLFLELTDHKPTRNRNFHNDPHDNILRYSSLFLAYFLLALCTVYCVI